MIKHSFRIIIPTKKTISDFKQTTEYVCIETLIKNNNEEYDIILDILENNSSGLSELYQQKLENSSEDYIVFMHDDLEIHDAFLFKKLIQAHTQYDLVGLAGATSQDYTSTEKPPVWHLSLERPQDARGFVSHYIPANFQNALQSHYNSVFFGPTPSSVVVVDGLFMSWKKSSTLGKKLYDSDFTFHFYDLAACVNAHKNNLNIGVFPIFCIHHGLGEFYSDKVWHELSSLFKEKFADYKEKI